MIIIRLIGGLGNQMFQYAAARCLADRLEQPLLLDIRAFDTYKLHNFGLAKLQIRARVATEQELVRYAHWKFKLLTRLPMLADKKKWYFQPDFGFDQQWYALESELYLSGYFQSEKFFKDSRSCLVKDFLPLKNMTEGNQRLLAQIEASQSVCLHVRRGDYITDKKTLSIHGVCSQLYYQKAIDYFKQRLRLPTFFIFSNDITWVRENLNLGKDIVVVEGNQAHPEYDLVLMSRCKHHIIANSSFSWWGAWLSEHPEQAVVWPCPWVESAQIKTQDLIPDHWLAMDKNA